VESKPTEAGREGHIIFASSGVGATATSQQSEGLGLGLDQAGEDEEYDAHDQNGPFLLSLSSETTTAAAATEATHSCSHATTQTSTSTSTSTSASASIGIADPNKPDTEVKGVEEAESSASPSISRPGRKRRSLLSMYRRPANREVHLCRMGVGKLSENVSAVLAILENQISRTNLGGIEHLNTTLSSPLGDALLHTAPHMVHVDNMHMHHPFSKLRIKTTHIRDDNHIHTHHKSKEEVPKSEIDPRLAAHRNRTRNTHAQHTPTHLNFGFGLGSGSGSGSAVDLNTHTYGYRYGQAEEHMLSSLSDRMHGITHSTNNASGSNNTCTAQNTNTQQVCSSTSSSDVGSSSGQVQHHHHHEVAISTYASQTTGCGIHEVPADLGTTATATCRSGPPPSSSSSSSLGILRLVAERVVAHIANRTNLSGTTYKKLAEHLNSTAEREGREANSFLRPRISTNPKQVSVSVRVFRDEVVVKHFDWFEYTTIVDGNPVVRSCHSCVVTTHIRPNQQSESFLEVNKQDVPFEEFIKALHAKVQAFCWD